MATIRKALVGLGRALFPKPFGGDKIWPVKVGWNNDLVDKAMALGNRRSAPIDKLCTV
jgi:hypothetical protein